MVEITVVLQKVVMSQSHRFSEVYFHAKIDTVAPLPGPKHSRNPIALVRSISTYILAESTGRDIFGRNPIALVRSISSNLSVDGIKTFDVQEVAIPSL